MLGPFKEAPFQLLVTSPLMTREKKGTTKQRVIMDLLFPKGRSVNSVIDESTLWERNFT